MIAITGLCKNFQSGDQTIAALRSVDLEVPKGEFFVLLGPSGSGKTTLLRSVAGLEKPNGGTIVLNGKTVYSASPRVFAPPEERQIGMVFQSYAIWPHLTVAENIGLVLTHGRFRLPKHEAAERIRQSLALVQLDDFDNRPARLLSGGQQQRVALARALAVNPALLLMDEPLSNLDARLREEVRANIKKLAVRLGITVLYVTHDQVEAMVVADRIAVMAHGEILQIGNPFELYRRPASSLVAEFFGSINWIHGRMRGGNGVDTEIGHLATDDARQYDGRVVVGVRPEDVKLDGTSPEDENRLEGKVLSSTFLGDQRIAEVRVREKTLVVKAPPDAA
ncbi:MAG TPA: ABC transporter ATP-binding protein, partial [Candidatus Binatia bacterium]|nr:ABC transporter ATP-binding protein [Candidatus Binatia bacterium]